MSPTNKRVTAQPDVEALTACMEEWPTSWAGVEDDKATGRTLVDELRPFVVHLVDRGLAAQTVRRHLNYLWAIGGEIVRELNYEPALRNRPARQLLLDAVDIGEAPLLPGATEAEQRSADATARKLLRFLRSVDVNPML